MNRVYDHKMPQYNERINETSVGKILARYNKLDPCTPVLGLVIETKARQAKAPRSAQCFVVRRSPIQINFEDHLTLTSSHERDESHDCS